MSWTPDPGAFLRDLEAKPRWLRRLADAAADDPWRGALTDARRVILIGMGSSRFAALAAAPRLRARGVDAVAEYASATTTHPGGSDTLAIAISASGGTEETVRALARHRAAGSRTIALTNAEASPLETAAERHVAMGAGFEEGGVACRSYQHTLGLLLALVVDPSEAAASARAAADATEELLADRDRWLPAAVDLTTQTGASFLLAPADRLSSAEQGALMLREGPRLQAAVCESGDWLHVDVYLTEPLDYRAIVFTGAPADRSIMGWMRERHARVLAVGGDLDGAAATVRYPGDDRPDVALLTEVLVPELIAADVWRTRDVPSSA